MFALIVPNVPLPLNPTSTIYQSNVYLFNLVLLLAYLSGRSSFNNNNKLIKSLNLFTPDAAFDSFLLDSYNTNNNNHNNILIIAACGWSLNYYYRDRGIGSCMGEIARANNVVIIINHNPCCICFLYHNASSLRWWWSFWLGSTSCHIRSRHCSRHCWFLLSSFTVPPVHAVKPLLNAAAYSARIDSLHQHLHRIDHVRLLAESRSGHRRCQHGRRNALCGWRGGPVRGDTSAAAASGGARSPWYATAHLDDTAPAGAARRLAVRHCPRPLVRTCTERREMISNRILTTNSYLTTENKMLLRCEFKSNVHNIISIIVCYSIISAMVLFTRDLCLIKYWKRELGREGYKVDSI